MAPNWRMRSGSRTTRKRAIWLLPPFGAFDAASRISLISSVEIGSEVKRRIARWLNIASPSGIERRSAPMRYSRGGRRSQQWTELPYVLDIFQVLQPVQQGAGHIGAQYPR